MYICSARSFVIYTERRLLCHSHSVLHHFRPDVDDGQVFNCATCCRIQPPHAQAHAYTLDLQVKAGRRIIASNHRAAPGPGLTRLSFELAWLRSTDMKKSWLLGALDIVTGRDAHSSTRAKVEPHPLTAVGREPPTVLVIWHKYAIFSGKHTRRKSWVPPIAELTEQLREHVIGGAE